MVAKARTNLSTGLCKACPHDLWISRRRMSGRGQEVSSTTQVHGRERLIELVHMVMQAVSTCPVDITRIFSADAATHSSSCSRSEQKLTIATHAVACEGTIRLIHTFMQVVSTIRVDNA